MKRAHTIFILLLALLLTFATACKNSTDDDDDNDAPADDDNGDDDDDDDTTPADDDDNNTLPDDDTGDDDTEEPCGTVIIGPLEWTQCDNGEDINHYDAISYVKLLELDGKNDWRMPSRAELQSLYDESFTQDTDCYLPAHIVEPFRLSCSWQWTGEVVSIYEDIAWTVGFSHGTVTIEIRDNSSRLRVLAVRDLPD